jgi:alpha-1,6-mannosyltransferase
VHLVDISALYSPNGGGIRTYTHRKLQIADALGKRLTVIVPGAEAATSHFGSARLISIPSPRFPLDRNYFYFESDAVIHRALDREAPDFIEASSPWGSASAVAEWPGAAPRALIMHSDPLSAFAYRWLENVVSRRTIDRGMDWFWRHLRRLDASFDTVICASPSYTQRLQDGGMQRVITLPMGVQPDLFSPQHRDPDLRRRLLERCQIAETGTLLLGVGRLSPDKRWPMLIAGAVAAGYSRPIGMVIVGDGLGRAAVVRAAGDNPHVQLLSPIIDRAAIAQLYASADLLIAGSAAETFGMVMAEARASGLPIIVPDEGAAYDQLVPGQGLAYASGDAASVAVTIGEAIASLPALRAAAVAGAADVPTMDMHFARLFATYDAIIASRRQSVYAGGPVSGRPK